MSSIYFNSQQQSSFDIDNILKDFNNLNGFFQNQTKQKAQEIIKLVFGTFPVQNQIKEEKALIKKEIRELTERKMIKHHTNGEMKPDELVKLWDKLPHLDLDEDVYQKALKIPGELLQKLLSFKDPRYPLMRCIECRTSVLTYSDMLKVPDELLEMCLDLPIPNVLLQDLLSKSQEVIRKILDLKDVGKIVKELRTHNPQPIKRSYEDLVEYRLCTSKNTEAPLPYSSLAQHQPILIATLTDKKVKNKTFMSSDKYIYFKNDGGLCKGMSNWFVMLYFILQPNFKSQKACLTAIASQFKKGAENESILMQSLAIKCGKLIDLQIDIYLKNPKSLVIKSKKLYKKSSRPSEIVSDIEPGVYVVEFKKHRTVCIKLPNNLSFYFDPNKGLFELPSKTHDEDLVLLLKKSCKNKRKHCVKFIHCQPRDSFPKFE